MESEKPRGIVIPTARAMAATLTLSGSFSAGSVPIRAPLTIDDDDYSGSVTDEHNSTSSDASSYSRGTDDTELEDVVMGGIRVHSLLGEESIGETGDGSDFSGGSVIYRPFAGDIEEETSVTYSSLEEESENSDEVEEVSESEVSEADIVSVKAKVVVPKAILSLDDDEFDEILHSDDEDIEVQYRTLHYGDDAMVDEPECSDSVVGEIFSTDKLSNGLISLGDVDDQRLGVPPRDSNYLKVENDENSIDESMRLGGSSKQLIEKEVVQKTIFKEDGSCSIHEFDALMKPGHVEGVLDDVEGVLGEMGMTDKPECLCSVSLEEDVVQVKLSEENSLAVAPRDCNEFMVEGERNAVEADKEFDETFSQIVDQGEGHECISKERVNRIDDDSSWEADDLIYTGEGSIGLGSKESWDEGIGTMTGEAEGHCKNDCTAISESCKPECKGEPETGMSSENYELTSTLEYVTTRNLEVTGGIDVISGCGSSDQKVEEEAENVGKQEVEDIDRKLSLVDEDRASILRSSFETANESVENGEQVSEQISKQEKILFDSEPNQISVGIEETSLLPVKSVERTMPENSSAIAYDLTESKTQMGPLIHKHTFMEFDEYKGTSETREKLCESNFEKYSEEVSSDHSVQLISEKVKKRVEKTEFLKAKLQRIIRRIDLCSENSAVTEVFGEEHQTSLGLDYMSDKRKIMLPHQEFPDDLDFSINILVIGKTGVGKSATINSIFGEVKSPVGAFGVTTKSANYVVGSVGGILVRILDTPGLLSSATEERFNQKVLMSIKKSMRTFPVDVILYIDRLDENPDIHLLRIITNSLGSSIWQNTIVVLTHAGSILPSSLTYKDFIAQRSSYMHQSIRQVYTELSCVDWSKKPGIVMAENNMRSLCGNKTSESTCPDWRLNLLILCCSVKIQSEEACAMQKQNRLQSLTLLCSLWNVLLPGANSGKTCHSHGDLKEKRYLLDYYHEIFMNEQSQECLEQETLPVKNEEPEKLSVVGLVRRRKGRVGFQATKRFGVYLDTADLHTGFSIGSGGYREDEEGQGRMLVRMRGSMSVLGLVPMLISVFTSFYGRKDI